MIANGFGTRMLATLLISAFSLFAAAQSPPKTLNIQEGTPEAAIYHFYTALGKSDLETARQYLVAPEKLEPWLKVQVQISDAFRKLGDAATEKFGEADGKSFKAIPALRSLQALAKVNVEVQGDTATWPTNPKVPSKLVKVDGQWKLDLYASFQKPADIEAQISTLSKVARFTSQIADEISSGKLTTPDQVRAELASQRQLLNSGKTSP